jgi:hypothetical protein
LSTSRRAVRTNAAPPVSSSNTRSDTIFLISGECATQSSGASRSGGLFQSAPDLSTRASIGQSLSGSCTIDGALEKYPDMFSRPAIPPRHQAFATSGPPYERPGVSADPSINQASTSIHDNSTPFRTCLPLEFPTQVSNPFAPPQASTHVDVQEPSLTGITSTGHSFVDEQYAFPTKYPKGAQKKLSEARSLQPQGDGLSNVGSRRRSQSAVAVSASRSKPDLPALTNQRINAIRTAFSLAW